MIRAISFREKPTCKLYKPVSIYLTPKLLVLNRVEIIELVKPIGATDMLIGFYLYSAQLLIANSF
jgi:hypothetical protein